MAIEKEQIEAIVEDLEDKLAAVEGKQLDYLSTGHSLEALYRFMISELKGLIR